jgi:hypothetical protein
MLNPANNSATEWSGPKLETLKIASKAALRRKRTAKVAGEQLKLLQ